LWGARYFAGFRELVQRPSPGGERLLAIFLSLGGDLSRFNFSPLHPKSDLEAGGLASFPRQP